MARSHKAAPPPAAPPEQQRVIAIRPEGPCYACKTNDYRLVVFGGVESYVCNICHPEPGKGWRSIVRVPTPPFTGPADPQWLKVARPEWTAVLEQATATGDKSRAAYARWILDVVLV